MYVLQSYTITPPHIFMNQQLHLHQTPLDEIIISPLGVRGCGIKKPAFLEAGCLYI